LLANKKRVANKNEQKAGLALFDLFFKRE